MAENPIKVSVLILTKNERADLPGCLRSVSWCDDVHVYDSGSTDDTVEIAQRMGAHVTQRTYTNSDAPFGGDEAGHRNWGLRHIPFKHEWVLALDADERATDSLVKALRNLSSSQTSLVGFRLLRKDYFLGTWIRHVTVTPYQVRIFKPAHVSYERVINPVTHIDGEVGDLDAHFDHYPFSKGISHWFSKHNGYSSEEARHIVSAADANASFSLIKAVFSRDISVRRRHQKGLYYRLPLRPLVMFMGLYIGKRGFLDGRAGLVYAILRAIYEYMIVLKAEELRQQG
ncbi:MAG TPA: glycosyltransferase family 2 protein [Aquabacterium sp.]|uniref:glycosyltransferase family 2 protein n=1 Tax=Aquabacterium sp. TaxID=1872578 RepID=UPI002E373360|nr:glycosyltransferase family 2 protein [Aquabacterium sp.]HEX5357298.1 glycosyltransferase family 2 protein [Aquabacterium sp.]